MTQKERSSLTGLPKDHYTTRAISEQVPVGLQLILWDILEKELNKHPMDYLQALTLNQDESGTLHIDYRQNQPACRNLYSFAGMESLLPGELNGRTIFALDDITHITMLFSEEY